MWQPPSSSEKQIPSLQAAIHKLEELGQAGLSPSQRTLVDEALAHLSGIRRREVAPTPPGSEGECLEPSEELTQKSLRRYATRLELLRRACNALQLVYTPEEVAASILPFVVQSLACVRADVTLLDQEAKEAVLLAVLPGAGAGLDTGQRYPLAWDWFVEELARGEPSTIDLAPLDSPGGVLETFRAQGIERVMSLPLRVNGELLGALTLGLSEAVDLSPENEELAREIAGQLAAAIHKALLYEELEQYASTLEESVLRRTRALQGSNARFRTIFENAAIGIALVDLSGRVLVSNPALQRMLGYDARELAGMRVSQFIHPDDIEARNRLFQALLAGDQDHFTLEKRYVRKDGSAIWVHPTVSLVRTPGGIPRYAVKMVEDVTLQKEAREALVHADRLKVVGQLGASLAHEINNPLMSVITSLGLVEEMLDPADEARLFVKIALEELDRAAAMVSRLRDLNRKSRPDERQSADINELVSRVLALTRMQCRHQEVSVNWEPGPDLPPIIVAPDRIHQVVLNLVLNALEWMPAGGRLRLATERLAEPDGVQITVADTGRGLDPDAGAHLFQPFYTTRPGGMGLGLYICKSIVQEHGGRIEADSTPGQGTTFRVWLPLEPGRSPENGEQTDAAT